VYVYGDGTSYIYFITIKNTFIRKSNDIWFGNDSLDTTPKTQSMKEKVGFH
jgi:hypothetical protein